MEYSGTARKHASILFSDNLGQSLSIHSIVHNLVFEIEFVMKIYVTINDSCSLRRESLPNKEEGHLLHIFTSSLGE